MCFLLFAFAAGEFFLKFTILICIHSKGGMNFKLSKSQIQIKTSAKGETGNCHIRVIADFDRDTIF